MPASEFDIIARYFTDQSSSRADIILGIGDDAAIVAPPADQQLAIAIDTLVAGVHFPKDTTACDIGWKALAVNLSDMAAMGAAPAWFTLALTLPEANEQWLTDFSAGLHAAARQYEVRLIGGDTTHGPLTISVQIAGYVQPGQALTRSGARPGDQIWVSGTLGDAALGLLVQQQKLHSDTAVRDQLLQRLNRPTPRVALGERLAGVATSCIDISDGLLADLQHILDASGKGAEIFPHLLPLSEPVTALLQNNPQWQTLPLYGGDDYELCFTVSAAHADLIEQLQDELHLTLTCIGEITGPGGLTCLTESREVIAITSTGYDHFKQE